MVWDVSFFAQDFLSSRWLDKATQKINTTDGRGTRLPTVFNHVSLCWTTGTSCCRYYSEGKRRYPQCVIEPSGSVMYCPFGVNPSFMFALKIEASKPPKIDLTSGLRHRMIFLYTARHLLVLLRPKNKVKLPTQSA